MVPAAVVYWTTSLDTSGGLATDARIGLGDTAGLGEDERHRVLGGRDRVGLRRVDHDDARPGCRLQIDVVHADAGPPDHLEVAGARQDVLGHPGAGPQGQAVNYHGRTERVWRRR
mgnify:CR=1 FL=1